MNELEAYRAMLDLVVWVFVGGAGAAMLGSAIAPLVTGRKK
jgi:hypothetical protein